MDSYLYAYLVGDGILAIIWLTLFFLRKDLRKQQLLIGFPAPLAGVLADFYHQDYWHPQYFFSFKLGGLTVSLENFLFAFLISGIVSVLYEAVFRKRHLYAKPRTLVSVALIITLIFLMFFLKALGLNSIWASILALLTGSLIALCIDKDIIQDAIWTSILTAILIIMFYFIWLTIYPKAIQNFWLSSALSGIKLWKIPIEEIAWFTSAGFSFGILYEFWLNVRKYPKKLKG